MNLLSISRLGWRYRTAALTVAAAIIISLGFVRVATDAEYAFTSFALIPVIAATWICGRNSGLLLAALAAATWGAADFASDRVFSSDWIPATNAITRAVTYVVVVLIMSWLKSLLAQIEEMASHDPLTGLLNRRAFDDFGEETNRLSRRYNHSSALAFVDLDNFKKLNDSQGHYAGDLALVATADALRYVLRASDIVARLGGDEFAVIFPEIDQNAATEAGQKIFNAIQIAMQEYAPVSVSIGIAWYRVPKERFAEMLKDADALMYDVKQQGKSGMLVRIFDDTRRTG